jgi:hypothetical protein
MHLDLLLAHALASVAAAALLVEAEPPGVVSADLRLWQSGEHLSDEIEHARVGSRVRGRRVAEWILIDVDDLVEVFEAADVVVGRARGLGPVQLASDDFPEPLTPVTATNAPSGISTLTFFRLCCRAPMI